jgi:hypothetical protein
MPGKTIQGKTMTGSAADNRQSWGGVVNCEARLVAFVVALRVR